MGEHGEEIEGHGGGLQWKRHLELAALQFHLRGNNKGNFSRVLLPLRKRPFVAPRLPEDTQSTKQLAQENDEGVVVTIKETDSSTCTLAMHQASTRLNSATEH